MVIDDCKTCRFKSKLCVSSLGLLFVFSTRSRNILFSNLSNLLIFGLDTEYMVESE